jgi:hypothetical protein
MQAVEALGSAGRRLFLRSRTEGRNTMRKDKIAIGLGVIAALVIATTAFAAKSTSSLNLVVLGAGAAPAAAATAEPAFGGQITFDVSTQADTPYVNVRCYQDCAFVYDGWQGFYPSYYKDPIFTLSSGYWTGGAADCTARLLYFDRQGRDRTLATTDFHVAA